MSLQGMKQSVVNFGSGCALQSTPKSMGFPLPSLAQKRQLGLLDFRFLQNNVSL